MLINILLYFMEEFIYLCRLYGGLDELVQAGGGNISIKLNDTMIIKSSGMNLADVTEKNGYSIVKLINFENITDTTDVNLLSINHTVPSLETFFHLFLQKYTIHLHPTLINVYMCSNNMLPQLDEKYLVIDYFKPSYTLSKEIYKKYNGEKIIFLKNHGVIFTSDDFTDINKVINKCYKNFVNDSQFLTFTNLEEYEQLVQKYKNCIVYKIPSQFGTKIDINNLLAYTPDILIYLKNSLIESNNNLYIVSSTKYKCLQILEVYVSYITLFQNCTKTLSEIDCNNLLNWDKEKYRLTK